MQDVFITKIHIDKARHLENVDIAISDTERKHLILTGKNGSGKTSLLEAMRDDILIKQRENSHLSKPASVSSKLWGSIIFGGKSDIQKPRIDISYSTPINNYLDVSFVYISAVRNMSTVPKAIEPIDIR